MELIVCVKQVPDPEAPPASFKVDAATNKVVPPPGVAPVVSTFDETAVEAALKVKDAKAGSKACERPFAYRQSPLKFIADFFLQ